LTGVTTLVLAALLVVVISVELVSVPGRRGPGHRWWDGTGVRL